MQKTDIKSQTLEELKNTVLELGEKPFRAKQLYEWMHVKLADDFDEMTNLSKNFRQKLKENCTCFKKSGSSDFQDRWHKKVSVCTFRWKCGRKCAYALSSWKQCVYFFSGRL